MAGRLAPWPSAAYNASAQKEEVVADDTIVVGKRDGKEKEEKNKKAGERRKREKGCEPHCGRAVLHISSVKVPTLSEAQHQTRDNDARFAELFKRDPSFALEVGRQ